MNFIINVLKGMVMGVANIIPGVSGGTMAVTMGIYDKIIGAINTLFKNLVKSIKILLPIFVGMGLGIIFSSLLIEKLLERYPLQTNSVFIGLILGGLPIILNKVKGKKINIASIVCFLLFFGLIIGLQLIGADGNDAGIEMSFVEFIILVVIGIIASATMIVPGVSGSMVLMILGYYQPVIENVNGFIKGLTGGNFGECIECAKILIPFGIGVVVGIFAIAKLIEFLFKTFEKETYYAILGLICASPIAIIMNTHATIHTITIIASVICAIVGFVVARALSKTAKEDKK